ncbi:MAG: cytochrome c peroxidase [Myxococcota bacterium]
MRGGALIVLLLLTGCGESTDPSYESLEALGEALFFETSLSANRTQACATCHNPERGFVDDRIDETGQVRPVSLGDDGSSFGTRNAPSAAYAAFAPEYTVGIRQRFNRQNSNRLYEGPLGGLFYDGRAATVEAQAGGPPTNPGEMGLSDEAMLVSRLREDPLYTASFERFFGASVFSDATVAYAAFTEAVGAYERSEVFSPFDSKYDRALRGEATLSFKELTGRALFFSEFANCAICHQLHGSGDPVNKFAETFTGYEFHNIGVPANPRATELSGVAGPDLGLGGREDISDLAQRGKFKTPTLRNIAVTGPYMHNGVFEELRTVVEFYDQYNNPERRVNPETAEAWRPAEISENVALDLLGVGRAMSDLEVESMVCFLRTLTDARYEPLLVGDASDCE